LEVHGIDDQVQWLNDMTFAMWVQKAYDKGAVAAGCPDTVPGNPAELDSLMRLDLIGLTLPRRTVPVHCWPMIDDPVLRRSVAAAQQALEAGGARRILNDDSFTSRAAAYARSVRPMPAIHALTVVAVTAVASACGMPFWNPPPPKTWTPPPLSTVPSAPDDVSEHGAQRWS